MVSVRISMIGPFFLGFGRAMIRVVYCSGVVMEKRPVFLNPLQIRLPVPGLVSILHRLSGLFLFLALPWVLCAFYDVQHNQDTFARLERQFMHGSWRFAWWFFLSALSYHLLAGMRHIGCDLGWLTSSKEHAFWQSVCVLLVALGLSCWYGVRLW
jgi:succinate dehydrogenase / fumarate reductase, cytochrome b subunit